jgi:hypothetical protein
VEPRGREEGNRRLLGEGVAVDRHLYPELAHVECRAAPVCEDDATVRARGHVEADARRAVEGGDGGERYAADGRRERHRDRDQQDSAEGRRRSC